MAGYHGPDPPGSMREQGRRSSAGPLARLGGVLVLAPSGTLTDAPPVQDFVDDNATRLPSGAIVGGTAAISTSVEAALEQLLDR